MFSKPVVCRLFGKGAGDDLGRLCWAGGRRRRRARPARRGRRRRAARRFSRRREAPARRRARQTPFRHACRVGHTRSRPALSRAPRALHPRPAARAPPRGAISTASPWAARAGPACFARPLLARCQRPARAPRPLACTTTHEHHTPHLRAPRRARGRGPRAPPAGGPRILWGRRRGRGAAADSARARARIRADARESV